MERNKGTAAVLSSLASVMSLVAALSCCLPLGTLLMSAGAAGASLFSESMRPWLLGLSVASLVFAFVQTYGRSRCDFRRRRLRTVLLWFSTAVVVSLVAAPAYFSGLIAGRFVPVAAASELRGFQDADFKRRFDAASDGTRLVVLLSPT